MPNPGIGTVAVAAGPWFNKLPRLKFALLVFGYALSMAGSNLIFKVASDKIGGQWWLWFLLGNFVGFGCPVLITYALREQSPHVVYAFTLGAGFVLVQLAGWLFFRAPITPLQIGGLVFTALGLVMLQFGRA
jgi:multidrug transporter EmrE-like cation transporter